VMMIEEVNETIESANVEIDSSIQRKYRKATWRIKKS
jgi:hypothetical protein